MRSFRIITLAACLLIALSFKMAYASDTERIKINLMEGNYKEAIKEGENILAQASDTSELDELYYILGLSYLKDGNILRASDIFEIILREFKNSKFKDDAKLALGNTYFLRGDFSKAEECYKEILKDSPNTKLKPELYSLLGQVGFKKGDTEQAKEYLAKLKKEFPLYSGEELIKDLNTVPDAKGDYSYTIQVGSFSSELNAKNLIAKLSAKGYSAYIEEGLSSRGKKYYKVRVGKLTSHNDAKELRDKLEQEGYPTKIIP
ncbi:MAG: SPOR domain-containing protein [Candidatus Omnitrophica bacterium]|nr:SPOR domain-containing protein [Candidatus Omnitrophota bacterium]